MKVKVYSTPFCFFCKQLKEFLKENKIKFEEVNVQEDQEAAMEMIQKTGQTGVPVTEIDGKIIIGFDEEKLREVLKL